MFQIPCKGYFGQVSLKSLLSTMYEFVTFNINIFLQELWVSHFNRIPETYDAYVALGEQHL
jgi:hypothetical protein